MAQKIPLLRAAVIVYRSKPSSARWIAKKKSRGGHLCLPAQGHNALGKSNHSYAPTVLRDQNSPSCLLDFVLLDALRWRLREPC